MCGWGRTELFGVVWCGSVVMEAMCVWMCEEGSTRTRTLSRRETEEGVAEQAVTPEIAGHRNLE